jgi:hypothetical protein
MGLDARLAEAERAERDVAYGMDMRPADTANWHHAEAIAEARKRIAELEAAQKSIVWENAGLRVQVNKLERRVAAQRRHITKLIALLRKTVVR